MSNYSHYISQNATITMTAAEFMFAIDAAKDSVAIDPDSAAYKAGRKDEQDYIIQLIESLDCLADGKEHDCNPLDQYTITDLIELIKGEQK